MGALLRRECGKPSRPLPVPERVLDLWRSCETFRGEVLKLFANIPPFEVTHPSFRTTVDLNLIGSWRPLRRQGGENLIARCKHFMREIN